MLSLDGWPKKSIWKGSRLREVRMGRIGLDGLVGIVIYLFWRSKCEDTGVLWTV